MSGKNCAWGRSFKKCQRHLRERNEIKFGFIKTQAACYPLRILCCVMKVSKSAFYVWCALPSQLVTPDELSLYRQAKTLFKISSDSLGSRELSKKLNETGYEISRYRTIKLMKQLRLKVKQRIAYKVTIKHKHSDKVTISLLNKNLIR
jgi:putative transposase